MKMEFWNL